MSKQIQLDEYDHVKTNARYQDEYETFQKNKKTFTDAQKVEDLEKRIAIAEKVKDEGRENFKQGHFDKV